MNPECRKNIFLNVQRENNLLCSIPNHRNVDGFLLLNPNKNERKNFILWEGSCNQSNDEFLESKIKKLVKD